MLAFSLFLNIPQIYWRDLLNKVVGKIFSHWWAMNSFIGVHLPRDPLHESPSKLHQKWGLNKVVIRDHGHINVHVLLYCVTFFKMCFNLNSKCNGNSTQPSINEIRHFDFGKFHDTLCSEIDIQGPRWSNTLALKLYSISHPQRDILLQQSHDEEVWKH